MNLTVAVHHYFHHPGEAEFEAKLDKIADSILSLRRQITMNQAELETSLSEIKITLIKVGGEIDAFKTSAAADTAALQTAIAGLEAELANAGGPSPAAAALVAELKDLSLILDGKIADLPAIPA